MAGSAGLSGRRVSGQTPSESGLQRQSLKCFPGLIRPVTVVNRTSAILRIAAMAIGRTDSWLGRFYRRKKAQSGAPKAITATARKLACVVYNLLKYQEN